MKMEARYLDRLCQAMQEHHLDALLIAPSTDLTFLCGSNILLCERFQGLVLKRDGHYFYICNTLTETEIKELLGDDLEVYVWHDNDGFTDVVREAFTKHGLIGGTIAVNAGVRGFNIGQIMSEMDVKFVNGKDIMQEMTIIKTDAEQENLRIAASLVDRAIGIARDYAKIGMTEQQVKERLLASYVEEGAQATYHLIATGANGALPHYLSTSGVIQRGDALMLDINCKYRGMCADTTRTFFMGEASAKQREVYAVVLEANLAGEAAAGEGAYIPDIEKAARDVIDRAGYGKYFCHRLGHGIGYEGHEAPEIKMINKRKLERGMAFSIEPGIYLPGEFGVRIEDIVLINSHGEKEILNKTPKELTILS